MTPGNYSIRCLTQKDAQQATELSADAGWHQPLTEIQEIIDRSGQFILGAFNGEKLLGMAAAYGYLDIRVAFINEVIVHSSCRNRGIATALLQTLFSRVRTDFPVLRLYATAFGRPLYEKLGFVPYGTICFCHFKPASSRLSERIFPMTSAELPAAIALDKLQFGANREALLRQLYAQFPNQAWCLKDNGTLTGFILKGRMNWLFQSRSLAESSELLCHANAHHGEPYLACLWQEDAKAFSEISESLLEITAMQSGTARPFPQKHHSGCLPDIG